MKVHIARVQLYGEDAQIIGIFSSNKRARDACNKHNSGAATLIFRSVSQTERRSIGHDRTLYFVETIELNELWT